MVSKRRGIPIGVLIVLFVAANHARRNNADPPPPAPIIENARVRVWDVAPGGTPAPALPGPPQDARRIVIELQDVVVTYLADGTLTSTDAQGKTAANERHFGETRFNARDRVHTEMLARGEGRAMMVELK